MLFLVACESSPDRWNFLASVIKHSHQKSKSLCRHCKYLTLPYLIHDSDLTQLTVPTLQSSTHTTSYSTLLLFSNAPCQTATLSTKFTVDIVIAQTNLRRLGINYIEIVSPPVVGPFLKSTHEVLHRPRRTIPTSSTHQRGSIQDLAFDRDHRPAQRL